MTTPRVFIGSSQKHLNVARAIESGLEKCCARVDVWDEGVFTMNKAFLERLVEILDDYDFAVLVFASDDLTTSKGSRKASPRDNVIFECGLFMGALGRDRVFIVHDGNPNLKIPTDFSGITLASFDPPKPKAADKAGTAKAAEAAAEVKAAEDEIDAAVANVCRMLRKEIRRPRSKHIVGKWVSRYMLTMEADHTPFDEEVKLMPWRDGLKIVSEENPKGDYYEALGRILVPRQLAGRWVSRADAGDLRGTFILTVSPRGNVMYGYYTSVDENDGTVYTDWVLTKLGEGENKEDEAVQERLRAGLRLLRDTTKLMGPKARKAHAPSRRRPRPGAGAEARGR